jgi:hypothetical protein
MFVLHRRVLLAWLAIGAMALAIASPVLAHEQRTVAGYDMEVGFIDEPVYTGDRSGLEFSVFKDGQPVLGLESTLTAQVIFEGQSRDLPLSARDDSPGWYESVFVPTAAGPYTFHISGAIEGTPIDETFTSSPTGFDEVQAVTSGQFPTALPPIADIAADATKGAQAASQVPIALGAGILGIVVGLVGIGLALGARRRTA